MRLNGAVRRDPEAPVDLDRDRVSVEGRPIEGEQKIYLMMNKPRGLITTAADEKGRATIYSLLANAEALPWVAPVGRLDKASEGLLLLTNDSEWGAHMASPDAHLEKTYHVQIGSIANESLMKSLASGIRMEDGDSLRALRVSMVRAGHKNSWLEIVLGEGRNRQIRRMLEATGTEVLRLVRVAIGPLQLGSLGKGSFRELSEEEKQSMDRALSRANHVRPEGCGHA